MLSRLLRLPAQWPHVVMLVIAAGWCLLALLTAPLFDVVYTMTSTGVLILLAYVAAFVLGSWAVSMVGRGNDPRAAVQASQIATPNLRFAFVGAMVLAVIGMALRLYDRLILRNASVSLSEIAGRKFDVGLTASDSPLGLLAAPLTGFCLLPAILVLLNPKLVGRNGRLAAFAVALYPPFESVYFQGGTAGVALAVLLLISVLATRPRVHAAHPQRRRKRSHLTVPQQLALVAFGVGGVILGGTLFAARVKLMTGSISQYLLFAAGSNANIVVPSQLALKLVEIPFFGQIAFIIYWISLYVTSGVYNLLFILDRGIPYHTGGETQGQVFLRAFDILTGNLTRPSIGDANPLLGLYQTMFGDVFIDFGVVGGVVQCLIMGVVAALVHRARLRGHFAAQIIDPVLKTFLLMGIFISSLTSFGLFVLIASLVVIGVSAFAPKSTMGRTYELGRRNI